jgi:hypothetical protein
MLTEARGGRFQPPPAGHHFERWVECRVDRPHAFHGSDVCLCKIAIARMPLGFE